jgi:hypothetical protein
MSEPSVCLKRHRLAQAGPLTIVSFGIVLSFAWATFLGWLMVCLLDRLI